MNDVIRAAAELQEVCEEAGWRYCFIGGIAVMRWGQPRETVDADLTLFTGFGNEAPYIATLLETFAARIPDAARFAEENRVLLMKSSAGVGLDVALGGLPFEELMIERSSSFEYPPGQSLRTCSAEDLVILKAFANRAHDWADVEGIIVRQSSKLDWEYIQNQLGPLAALDESLEILRKLERCRAQFES